MTHREEIERKKRQLLRIRLSNSAVIRAERALVLAQKSGQLESLDFEGPWTKS